MSRKGNGDGEQKARVSGESVSGEWLGGARACVAEVRSQIADLQGHPHAKSEIANLQYSTTPMLQYSKVGGYEGEVR
jgi:hypothetical protein